MCHLYPYNNVKLLRKFFFTLIFIIITTLIIITHSLFHSKLKTYFSTNPSHLILHLPAFMTTGLDRTYHAHRFIFSFTL